MKSRIEANGGWLAFSRAFLFDAIGAVKAKRRPFTDLEVIIWLELYARYGSRTRSPTNHVQATDTGEVAVSIPALARLWGWSEWRVREFITNYCDLGLLEKTVRGRGRAKCTVLRPSFSVSPLPVRPTAGHAHNYQRDSDFMSQITDNALTRRPTEVNDGEGLA